MPKLRFLDPEVGGNIAPEIDAGAIGGGSPEVGRALQVVGEVATQLAEAELDSRVSKAAAEYAAGLERIKFELETDPDFETFEDRFAEAEEKLRNETRSQIGILPRFQRRFEQKTFELKSRGELAIRSLSREKRLAAIDANMNVSLNTHAELASQTDDLKERQVQIGLAMAEIDAGVARGNIKDEAQAQAMREKMLDTITQAEIERGLREDPEGLLERLSDESDPRTADMDQVEKEKAISAAERELRRRDTSARSRAREARAREKEARRALQDAVSSEAHELLRQGELTMDWVEQNEGGMSDAQRRYLGKRAEEGGGYGKAGPDFGYYGEVLAVATRAETDPVVREQFAEMKLDPDLLGSKFPEVRKLQAAAERGIAPVPVVGNSALIKQFADEIGRDADRGEFVHRAQLALEGLGKDAPIAERRAQLQRIRLEQMNRGGGLLTEAARLGARLLSGDFTGPRAGALPPVPKEVDQFAHRFMPAGVDLLDERARRAWWAAQTEEVRQRLIEIAVEEAADAD